MATTIAELVAAFFETAFAEPAEGETLFSFQRLGERGALDERGVLEALDSGHPLYALELTYNEDLRLMQRGEGRLVRDAADLWALAASRLLPMTDQHVTLPADVAHTPPPATLPWEPLGWGAVPLPGDD